MTISFPADVAVPETPTLGERADRERSRWSRLVLRALTFWRSPDGQPQWARPMLLAVAVVSGLAYGWGLADDVIEPFYGAAARSMSTSWHDFFFGAFDPYGTVTVDKLPGELWVQALLLRVTGFHLWAIVLPQVLEGSLTVLVLYRAVRRVGGPFAGMAAAVCFAASPIVVLLNRGNISESLFILLLALAADSATAAITSARTRPLVIAGVWVGLAFQAKMLEAWVLIPAIALAYLLAAPISRKRLRAVALFGLVAVGVSISWMTVVQIVPAHDRPYVDASRNNSEFEQVFFYNGIERFGPWEKVGSAGKPAPLLANLSARGSLSLGTSHVRPAWNRLLTGPFALDGGWLLPASAIAMIGLAFERRRRRMDAIRFSIVVLWAFWLGAFFVVFSTGRFLNSYYVAVLAPPVAALCGLGVAQVRAAPRRAWTFLVAAIAASAAYGLWLLPRGASSRGWLLPSVIVVGLLAGLLVTVAFASSRRERLKRWALAVGVLAVVTAPAATSVVVVHAGLGSFDYPYEPKSVSAITLAPRAADHLGRAIALEASLMFPTPRSVVATETSVLAENYILFTGQEFLPIGGFLGEDPVPTLDQIKQLVVSGRLTTALVAAYPANPDRRLVWIRTHCHSFEPVPEAPSGIDQHDLVLIRPVILPYICTAAAVRSPAGAP